MGGSPTIQFARHYAEMVVVMLAGMFLLGGALLGIAAAVGMSAGELQEDTPGLALLGMGLSMTVPMVWWMRRRGHSWAANRAMALAMFLPALAMVALLASGAITDFDTLMGIEHSVMFPAMLVAMLPYRAEFTHSRVEATA
jgi:hypothetical protein